VNSSIKHNGNTQVLKVRHVIKFLADLGPMNLMDCFKKHFNRYVLLATWGVKVIETILLLALK